MAIWKRRGLLLQAGANAKACEPIRHHAAVAGRDESRREVAQALLKAGADPNAVLPGGETILMEAARTGSGELVELLFKSGANVAAAGPSFGETALMVAACAKSGRTRFACCSAMTPE